jgi:hypothetical protein
VIFSLKKGERKMDTEDGLSLVVEDLDDFLDVAVTVKLSWMQALQLADDIHDAYAVRSHNPSVRIAGKVTIPARWRVLWHHG